MADKSEPRVIALTAKTAERAEKILKRYEFHAPNSRTRKRSEKQSLIFMGYLKRYKGELTFLNLDTIEIRDFSQAALELMKRFGYKYDVLEYPYGSNSPHDRTPFIISWRPGPGGPDLGRGDRENFLFTMQDALEEYKFLTSSFARNRQNKPSQQYVFGGETLLAKAFPTGPEFLAIFAYAMAGLQEGRNPEAQDSYAWAHLLPFIYRRLAALYVCKKNEQYSIDFYRPVSKTYWDEWLALFGIGARCANKKADHTGKSFFGFYKNQPFYFRNGRFSKIVKNLHHDDDGSLWNILKIFSNGNFETLAKILWAIGKVILGSQFMNEFQPAAPKEAPLTVVQCHKPGFVFQCVEALLNQNISFLIKCNVAPKDHPVQSDNDNAVGELLTYNDNTVGGLLSTGGYLGQAVTYFGNSFYKDTDYYEPLSPQRTIISMATQQFYGAFVNIATEPAISPSEMDFSKALFNGRRVFLSDALYYKWYQQTTSGKYGAGRMDDQPLYGNNDTNAGNSANTLNSLAEGKFNSVEFLAGEGNLFYRSSLEFLIITDGRSKVSQQLSDFRTDSRDYISLNDDDIQIRKLLAKKEITLHSYARLFMAAVLYVLDALVFKVDDFAPLRGSVRLEEIAPKKTEQEYVKDFLAEFVEDRSGEVPFKEGIITRQQYEELKWPGTAKGNTNIQKNLGVYDLPTAPVETLLDAYQEWRHNKLSENDELPKSRKEMATFYDCVLDNMKAMQDKNWMTYKKCFLVRRKISCIGDEKGEKQHYAILGLTFQQKKFSEFIHNPLSVPSTEDTKGKETAFDEAVQILEARLAEALPLISTFQIDKDEPLPASWTSQQGNTDADAGIGADSSVIGNEGNTGAPNVKVTTVPSSLPFEVH